LEAVVTILELAFHHCVQNGMPEVEAWPFFDRFAHGAGRDIGWDDIAPRLSPALVKRIDDAAVGWIHAHRLCGEASPGVEDLVPRGQGVTAIDRKRGEWLPYKDDDSTPPGAA
jgi:hypothetical protein